MIAFELESILQNKRLEDSVVSALFERMFLGQLEPVQIAALLTAWRTRPETSQELALGALVMQKFAIKADVEDTLQPLADNCGTGGDGHNSFNISTAAAIVSASLGVRIAKHGNRSVSSRCGSADLLFAAGFPSDLNTNAVGDLLKKTGFTFFYAANFHPVMKSIGPIRKSMGIRTIFNLLGPLANPIKPATQLIGVATNSLLQPMAEAAQRIGIKKALIVHSEDGLDEISPCAITNYVLVKEGKFQTGSINPQTFGITCAPQELTGGDSAHNLFLLRRLFTGRENGLKAAIALNAGALLCLAEKTQSLHDGYLQSCAVLENGHTEQFFNGWLSTARSLI